MKGSKTSKLQTSFTECDEFFMQLEGRKGRYLTVPGHSHWVNMTLSIREEEVSRKKFDFQYSFFSQTYMNGRDTVEY